MDFSEYIVYVDESGDHGLASVNPRFPVFVLAFCIFDKTAYVNQAVPALQAFKFKYFGHDMVILHEREIRKKLGPFSFMVDKDKQSLFHTDLAEVMDRAPFTLIGVAIHKERLKRRYAHPGNPYEIALTFGLERVYKYLATKGQTDRVTHIVFEGRGKKEDAQLELEFRRICDGGNFSAKAFPFKIVFANKQANSVGLQLADLVARPIGRHVLEPAQENRAYDILQRKFDTDGKGRVEGCGLKIFP